MPLYLAPYLGAGTYTDPFRPRGADSHPDWSALDLRADCTQPAGYALVATAAAIVDAQVVEVPDTFSAARASQIQTRLGLAQAVQARSAAALVAELLTRHADPAGTAFARPVLPDHAGWLRVRVGGRGFEARIADTGSPYWAKVRTVLQGEYRAHRAAALAGERNAAAFHRRWLQVQVERFGGAIDYREFIPIDLPDEAPLPHSTTISESFNTADSDTLGPDLTWSEITGDYDVVSNRARNQSVTGSLAQATTDLSSTNHYAEIVINISAVVADNGPACRAQSGPTAYLAAVRSVYNDLKLYKWVSGTYTQLGSTYSYTVATGDVIRVIADGSSISCNLNGTQRIGPVTDTAIASGVRAGISGYGLSYGDIDSFQAADLATLYTVTPAGGNTPAGAIAKQATPAAKAGTIASLIGALLKQGRPAPAGALATLTGTLASQGQKAASGSVASVAGALVPATLKAVAGVLATLTGAMARAAALAMSGSASPAGSWLPGRSWGGTVTPAGAATHAVSRALAGALASAGATLRDAQAGLVGAVATLAGEVLRLAGRGLSGAADSAGAILRAITMGPLAGALSSLAGALGKQVQQPVAGAVASIAGALGTMTVALVALAGTLASSTGSLVRATAQGVAGSVALLGALVKGVTQAPRAGSTTPAGALGHTAQSFLAGAASSAGALVRGAAQALAATVTSASALARATLAAWTGALTSASTGTRAVSAAWTGAVAALVGVVEKVTTPAPWIGSVGTIGSTAKAALWLRAGTTTLAGALSHAGMRACAGAATLAGGLARGSLKGMVGVLVSAGALGRAMTAAVAGGATTVGALGKRVVQAACVGTIASGGVFGTVVVLLLAVAGSIASGGALVRAALPRWVGVLVPAGARWRSVVRTFAGAIASLVGALGAIRSPATIRLVSVASPGADSLTGVALVGADGLTGVAQTGMDGLTGIA